jgi:DNA-sulfur modification-associated
MHAAVTPTKTTPRTIRPARAVRTFPAIIGEMGPRLATYSTSISPFDVVDILGHDPRSDRQHLLTDAETKRIYSVVQRKTTRARRDAIVAYLRNQLFDGGIAAGFPAISIAIQGPVRFDDGGSISGGNGQMILETGRSNRRIVIDGLGRLTGVLTLADLVFGDGPLPQAERDALTRDLERFSLPTVFYAPREGQPPLSIDDLGQLFHDFNVRGVKVPAKDAIALDKSDIYIQATYTLAEDAHAIKQHGGMEARVVSLSGKTTGIVAQAALLRFLHAAIEGETAVEASHRHHTDKPRFTRETRDRLLSGIADFVDDIATAMGPRWADRSSLHLSSAGWQAIGVLYHDVTVRLAGIETKKFATAIGELDWSRRAPMWAGIVDEKTRPGGAKELVIRGGGAAARRDMVKSLRERFGLIEKLAAASVAAGGQT